MKVIVTSWMCPNDNGYNSDERPKSIENISASIESCKKFVESCQLCDPDIEFASSIRTFFIGNENDEIKTFYKGDGFKYLEKCLNADNIGRCVARIYNAKRNEKRKKDGKIFSLFKELF